MKQILYTLRITCLLVLCACSYDKFEVDMTTSSTTMGVTVNLDRMTGESALRASVSPEQGEETVGSLYLYFFAESASREGLLIDYIKVTGPLAMDSRYALQTAGTGINISNAYNVIAVANIDDNQYIAGSVETWSMQWMGKSEEYFRTNALGELAEASGETDNSKAIASDKILMNGSTVKKAMNGEISVTLIRNVARFDVVNSTRDEYDLVSASIWNAYSRSSVTGDAVLEYSKSSDTRTGRFYGIDNTENIFDAAEGTLGDIRGGLYSFENKVTLAAANDQYTTCLVVGLKSRGGERVGYYRVNVHPAGSPQNLKRNNVYKINITGVIGEGNDSESEAYADAKSELIFSINNWDLDDNGLIVSDQYSILAIPAKTLRIGPEGGDFSCTVTTFSSLPSPMPLMVKNQVYDPSTGKIAASLSGSTLTVRAEPFASGDAPIHGIIVMSFAGLEAHINVVQSESVDTFLILKLEDTWTPKLGSKGGSSSEYIYVNASGEWTAELFGEGFTFDTNAATPVTVLKSASVANNKFHVYTTSMNDTDEERKAFILVTLDSDPINYVSAVPVYQKVVSHINIDPDTENITFNGNKVITSHPPATEFAVSCASDQVITGATLSGVNADKFSVNILTGSNEVPMTVTANEINMTGASYTATLLIEDSSGAERYVTLTQNSLTLKVTPSIFSTIAVTGGLSEEISVTTGNDAAMFTASISMASTSSDKALINHEAIFVDENSDEIDLSQPQSISTKFRVKFPKVYFPNRNVGISATVRINIENSGLANVSVINQSALSARTAAIWNSTSNWWGALTDGYYFNGYGYYLRNAMGTGASIESAQNTYGTMQVPEKTNYLHMGNQYMEASFSWTNTNNFLAEKDGILVIVADASTDVHISAANKADSPFGRNGYVLTGSLGSGDNITLYNDLQNTRVGQFITTRGVEPINVISGNYFYNGIHSALTGYPTSAVPILKRPNGDVMLTIDPKNKVVYIGEGQIYEDVNTYVSGGRGELKKNIVQYVLHATWYGSHFTDLLREDLGLPAPWDDVWGDNKWPN